MKRHIALGTLVLIGVLTMAVGAAQQPPPTPSADALTVEKVKDNLFVLRGGGGNTAVFVTATGVTLVDTKNPGWGQPLLDKVKTLTNKPVTTVINTHTHYDHVSGNVEMPTVVDIVAHENTKMLMNEMKDVYGLAAQPNVFKDKAGRGLVKRTFKDKMTIGSGADQVDLHYFGPAHTSGDAFVVFPALRVVHAGDTFPNKGLPIMDANNGGVGVEYPNTLMKAAAGLTNIDWIINGHTPAQTTSADLKEYTEFVREFVTTVQAAKTSGKTVDDVVKTWVTPAKYKGYPAANAERVRADATVVWNESK